MKAPRHTIAEAHDLLRTTQLPEERSKRDLLTASLQLADNDSGISRCNARRKGGKQTAKRGPQYFAKIAAMRKERKGGRPKKDTA